MSYAFTFDASACSGCKACQEACKDKNNLPAGLLWRRVIEVSGGEWHRAGSAWENSIFAYNLSVSCNHCTHPKCAGVCPTDAYTVRPDGLVLINPSRCMGCGYCSWACPYGAPQYDVLHGIMTKCDFCHDAIDAGLPPSCVAACPLRVLNYTTIEEMGTASPERRLWQLPGSEHPFPLPRYSRTEPHLAIKPHLGMNSPIEKEVSNEEEISPPGSFERNQGGSGRYELPLVFFSLLTQMAAGMAVYSLWISNLPPATLITIGILLISGGLISFMHLGRKRNSWRAFLHLKKSWLSREVLVAWLFGAAWVVTAWSEWHGGATWGTVPLAILGLLLVYCMAYVYHLRAVPSWNNWRTLVSFLLSAAVLGALGIYFTAPGSRWLWVAGVGMLVELVILLSNPSPQGKAGRLRFTLLVVGLIGILSTVILPEMMKTWLAILVLLFALLEEGIGRWQFYASRTQAAR